MPPTFGLQTTTPVMRTRKKIEGPSPRKSMVARNRPARRPGARLITPMKGLAPSGSPPSLAGGPPNMSGTSLPPFGGVR